VNPYRETPYAVGDEVEFVKADGYHLPFGTHRVTAIHTDGSIGVANGWAFPWDLRRPAAPSESEPPR